MTTRARDRSLGDGVYFVADDYIGLGPRIVILIVDGMVLAAGVWVFAFLSNPCASRFCCYWLRFPSDSFLNDDNVAQIESLNKLPAENELTRIVETSAITDESLRVQDI